MCICMFTQNIVCLDGSELTDGSSLPAPSPFVREVSAFDEYRRELSALGAKPEVILRKRREEQEESESSNDLQQEGDSEE